MKLKVLAIICLFVTCAISEENDENKIDQEENDSTLVLTDENFDSVVKADSNINYFIKFYAPW